MVGHREEYTDGGIRLSVQYTLYTEAYIDDQWVCINRTLPLQKETNPESLTPTYENGSRSYFGDASRKLESLGFRAQLAMLSQKLQTRFAYYLNDEMYCIYVIPFEKIEKLIPDWSVKEHHGFVLKDDVFAFESDEIEYIESWLSADEYNALDGEVKKAYQYYEWNDLMGWYEHFVQIVEHVFWQRWEWEYAYTKLTKLRLVLHIC